MKGRAGAGLGLVVAALLQAGGAAAAQRERGIGAVIEVAPTAPPRSEVDRSGKSRQVQAAIVSNPALASAAAVGVSGILPPGTTARVQNPQNGRSTVIRIQAGGPSSAGRLLDITPPVARALGVGAAGAQLVVAPLAVPQPDGTMRLGEGTRMAGAIAAPAVSERPED